MLPTRENRFNLWWHCLIHLHRSMECKMYLHNYIRCFDCDYGKEEIKNGRFVKGE